jgi:hypothetical protein
VLIFGGMKVDTEKLVPTDNYREKKYLGYFASSALMRWYIAEFFSHRALWCQISFARKSPSQCGHL